MICMHAERLSRELGEAELVLRRGLDLIQVLERENDDLFCRVDGTPELECSPFFGVLVILPLLSVITGYSFWMFVFSP